MYGDRRNPWHSSARRTYTRVSGPSRALGVRRRGVGQADLTAAADMAASAIPGGQQALAMVQDIPGISSLFNSSNGGPNDPRVKLLDQAYQQGKAGLNIATPYPGTGLPYLQNWLTDVPAHPNYSNGIAQALITALQTRSSAPSIAPGANAPVYDPVTGQQVAATYAGVPGAGGGISPVVLLVGVGLLVLVMRGRG
jgi:hypothetical protein